VTITVNGEPRQVADGATVDALLAALDDEVVPRAGHAAAALHEGDRVEIIVAVAGG